MTSRFNFGRSLRVAQADRQVTNRALAKEFGVGEEQVARWRTAADCKVSRAVELADFFGLSLDEFASLGSQP